MPEIPAEGTKWKNPLKFWRNKPPKRLLEKGTALTLKVPEKTDYWRKTRGNFVIDNAPFFWHRVTGDFEAFARVSAEFANNYDKAGLMVRLDEENWVLSGLEYFQDRCHHSTSVTKDFTDWTLSLLPDGSEKEGVWVCIQRKKNRISCSYSLDGEEWIKTRESIFSDRPALNVGIAAACPMGKEFRATFDQYRETEL